MKSLLSFVLTVIFCMPCAARTDCPAATIQHIQIEGASVLYSQSGVWRALGQLDTAGTRERYAALLAAQLSGKRVSVGYASATYDCSTTNYSSVAYIVRIDQ